jgi:hypothetical protein
MRFAYVYFMKDNPERVRLAVANHVGRWRATRAGRSQIAPAA